ncbi:DUF31 family putative serine protease, partial [Mycoplasmopsis synoviae]|uniref:DUF31 family putative serine protease n=1 Tax=Mycoplasmopsis synoviae TaxID=2109 RepID=UPI00387B0117
PRYLPNKIYKKVAMQTYAIEFFNRNSELEKNPKGISKAYLTYRGTAWILDYELDSNGYPIKWYLATNAHVAAGFMKVKSDGSRFTNIVDLNSEKKRFEEVQKT